MPFFPECVYDPATGELRIDERQQGFIVDPNRTLERSSPSTTRGR